MLYDQEMPLQRGMDFLPWVLGATIISGVVLFFTSLVIAYHNLGSRNIALGTAALTAAMFAFGLQLWFELRPSTRDDQVSFAYTVDFHDGQIRQWDYTKVVYGNGSLDILEPTRALVSSRINIEIEAGRWLFSQHRGALEQNLDKVGADFAVFSLVAFFANTGSDWQWRFRRYNSPNISFGKITPTSKREQCSVITVQDLRQQLSSAGNLFADAPHELFGRDVCLPVGTTIQVGSGQVVLQNRVLQIAFTLEDSGVSGDHMQPTGTASPHSQTIQMPKLSDGRFRYDTRIQSFVIKTTFSALRAYDEDKPTYEAWSVRLIEMVKAWFACC